MAGGAVPAGRASGGVRKMWRRGGEPAGAQPELVPQRGGPRDVRSVALPVDVVLTVPRDVQAGACAYRQITAPAPHGNGRARVPDVP